MLQLERSHTCFTMAAIVLYYLCVYALVICGSEWVTVALHSAFRISTEVITVVFDFYMAGATWNCLLQVMAYIYAITCATSYGIYIYAITCSYIYIYLSISYNTTISRSLCKAFAYFQLVFCGLGVMYNNIWNQHLHQLGQLCTGGSCRACQSSEWTEETNTFLFLVCLVGNGHWTGGCPCVPGG